MEDKKYSTIHYHNYLELDKFLDCQNLRSEKVEGKVAHDEMLFIVVHQAYELWFKQIIHEISYVHRVFSKTKVVEQEIGHCVHLNHRVVEILKLLVQQMGVMETMTPLDFLEFRDYLFPASGFQSFQFRVIETLLGLKDDQRITYNGKNHILEFTPEQREILANLTEKGSLVEIIEKWLERTPFVKYDQFEFIESYKKSLDKMLAREQKSIQESNYLSKEAKQMRLQMLGGTETYFAQVLDENTHHKLRQEGAVNFSYRATLGALFISLYRDEPLLRGPYNFLQSLMEIDKHLTIWRSRHALMVKGMIGKKIGTGGSSGHDYLNKTAMQHEIFKDLQNISTLLIPKSELMPLPENIQAELSFNF